MTSGAKVDRYMSVRSTYISASCLLVDGWLSLEKSRNYGPGTDVDEIRQTGYILKHNMYKQIRPESRW